VTIEQLYSIYLVHPSVQTDTRKLQKGDIFFALKGPNFDANTFVQLALDQGASYVVTDGISDTEDQRIIKVEDVLNTLQQLAKYHRLQFANHPDGQPIPFLAITGTNGKTTTKELISAVLASQYKTYTTQGNLNNHIGIPLTLLRIRNDAEIAVIEMGASHQKEIEGYCQYTLPTHGIITNCGKAHLEGFGGIEGVRKGKGELFDFLKAHNGMAFIDRDYDYLQSMSKGIQQVYGYGTEIGDIVGVVKKSEPFLEVEMKKGVGFTSLQTQLAGDYNLPNILCAIAVGKYFKVPDEKIKIAIEQYIPSNSRSQIIKKGTNQVILDAYNANPTSMKAAIENFTRLSAINKVLILGGMMELGEFSLQEHQAIVQLILQYPWKKVVLVGGDFSKVNHPFLYFDTAQQAKEWLNHQDFEHTDFLIKGSRSMQMENVLG
jgi:UDP-N-acetylmuramoyl-tripeptide--D-alanyl-D-alanine ligase